MLLDLLPGQAWRLRRLLAEARGPRVADPMAAYGRARRSSRSQGTREARHGRCNARCEVRDPPTGFAAMRERDEWDRDLLRAPGRWSAHLLLGEHPVPQRATRESSHRLKVPMTLRTLSEYGELDGCTPLGSLSAPLAEELDERGHRASLSGPRDVPSFSVIRPPGSRAVKRRESRLD